MILSKDRIAYYKAVELAAPEYQRPKGEQRPWVTGALVYGQRIEEILPQCFESWSGNCLEIGCYGGATTSKMVRVARRYGRTVIGVDPYTSRTAPVRKHLKEKVYPEFLRLSQPWRDAGEFLFLKARSQSAAARRFVEEHAPYAFVFIDGEHSYEAALSDLRLTLPLTNGVVCVDDWFVGGIRKATAKALMEFRTWRIALEVEEFAETYLMRGA
jgi:predicted O-methyltransferase YrrM